MRPRGARQRKGLIINGWLAIHKEAGLTSTRVVERVRQITKGAKAGHGGTLDSFSEGVLPIALGEATKTLSLVLNGDKAYRCWIRLGAESDTGDPTGVITPGQEPLPDKATIEKLLVTYLGEQEQIPPIYSAIHVNGERAYERARRGETVIMEPRKVIFHKLELIDLIDGAVAVVDVQCSKGSYMRSLARDLGRDLKCLAYLERLLRTQSLGFALKECITLDQLAKAVEEDRFKEVLLPVDRALDDIPALRLRLEAWSRIMQGQEAWIDADGIESGSVRLFSQEGEFGAIGHLGGGKDASGRRICTPKRLFHVA